MYQLLRQFASTYAMVNFEEVSVAGFQHVRVGLQRRCGYWFQNVVLAVAAAFCSHSLDAHSYRVPTVSHVSTAQRGREKTKPVRRSCQQRRRQRQKFSQCFYWN